MRRRILAVVLTTTVLAVVVFGVPLALVLQRLVVSNERSELESLALRAASTVSRPGLAGTDPVELPASEQAVELGAYDRTGTLISGRGPAGGDVAVDGATVGRIVDITVGDRLVVAVPVSSGEQVVGVVRAATSTAAVRTRVVVAWAAMLVAGAAAIALAGLLADRQTRRLTAPIERLARRAADLGDGDFAQRSDKSGIAEIDRAGKALDRTARRLSDMVTRERAVTAHASHQLRTPLTSLRLTLESALATGDEALRPAAVDAVLATQRMSRTIDDLLTLARAETSGNEILDVPHLLDGQRQSWTGALALHDRPLRLRLDDPPVSGADEAAVRQVLNVLLDNALQYGRGAVTVVARDAGDALAIDVTDEGSTADLIDPASRPSADHPVSAQGVGTHIGLRLAHDLALSQGGRLVHADSSPTKFTVYLPTLRDQSSPGDPPTGQGLPTVRPGTSRRTDQSTTESP